MNRVLFIQEVSGAYTSPFLDTDELKMALRDRTGHREEIQKLTFRALALRWSEWTTNLFAGKWLYGTELVTVKRFES